ncbi:hypothetical protein LJC46_00195 [Desulfovibrio sp. OttesenSCG-928-G15]|nr:hypothetical protein [Desulfovibrio sp. OttesenSCG-928-G15]
MVSQPPIKVYASFSAAPEGSAERITRVMQQAIADRSTEGEETVFQEGALLRISFEGLYFPLEEVLAELATTLARDATGKLDYLDMEAWTLTRHVFTHGAFSQSTRSLNHILDWSGH